MITVLNHHQRHAGSRGDEPIQTPQQKENEETVSLLFNSNTSAPEHLSSIFSISPLDTMSFVIAGSVPWHEGEKKMHELMQSPEELNPSAPYLSPGAAHLVQRAPLIALGTIDSQGRPWATVWGGEAGLAGPVAQSIIGIRNFVDKTYDPVVEALYGGKRNGEVVKEEGKGRLMSGLAVDMEARKRVKLMGRMVAGNLTGLEATALDKKGNEPMHAGQAQLVVRIEQSLGNCPKYINRKQITPVVPNPKLISNSAQLSPGAIELLRRADSLFISSYHEDSMDTNIRGGPPGFVRVVSNDISGAVIAYPEYSGNRLYQTLGNLQMTPLAGYAFPDFETGDILYLTGATEILVGRAAAALLPRSNLAVKVTVTSARYVENGLPFRGQPGQPSPYNPPVSDENSTTATFIKKDIITPTIGRFRFKISDPSKVGKWTPGQYATFSFAGELDMGYSHMKDDDPTSINDDYIRTFTVSSYPGRGISNDEFEITVKKHGSTTKHMFQSSERSGVEVLLKGFAGEFSFKDGAEGATTPLAYIAGGIGITPLIAQLPGIDISRLHLFWSVSARDLGLVLDTFKLFPELPKSTTLFITSSQFANNPIAEEATSLEAINDFGAQHYRRRMEATDLGVVPGVEEWYLCAGTSLKASVLNWLVGKKVIYEDFNY
ncbi:oxidoreductase [Histoplasma capsulatum]|uniref:Oxidoreductase n=2 Tax=Histoplasma TaxID=5036 RepID=A0A8A1MIW4_AJECA|nr:oxidoreductase [Histoplasma capsulatum]